MDIDKKIQQIKISILKKWLTDHDYIINKVFLGEWEATDPRYQNYLTERARIRAELDELTKDPE